MADAEGQAAEVMQQLEGLVCGMGEGAVAEGLRVTRQGLEEILGGTRPLEPEMVLEMERMAVSMGDAVGWLDMDPVPFGEDLKESVLAVDIDGDGEADMVFPGVGVVSTGENWDDRMERKRVSLWTSRSLAMMTQFRIGMKYQEHVAALGLVTQIELALIAGFRESVPEQQMVWDGTRRDREIQKRLARLRWVEREQEREFGGIMGFLKRMAGKERVSGKELYQRMLDEADAMLSAMSQADRGDRVMDEVMRYTGAGDLIDRGGRR